jgi:hypothetical protein
MIHWILAIAASLVVGYIIGNIHTRSKVEREIIERNQQEKNTQVWVDFIKKMQGGANG